MSKRVNIPGVGVVNFPDTMAEASIQQVIERDILKGTQSVISQQSLVEKPDNIVESENSVGVADRPLGMSPGVSSVGNGDGFALSEILPLMQGRYGVTKRPPLRTPSTDMARVPRPLGGGSEPLTPTDTARIQQVGKSPLFGDIRKSHQEKEEMDRGGTGNEFAQRILSMLQSPARAAQPISTATGPVTVGQLEAPEIVVTGDRGKEEPALTASPEVTQLRRNMYDRLVQEGAIPPPRSITEGFGERTPPQLPPALDILTEPAINLPGYILRSGVEGVKGGVEQIAEAQRQKDFTDRILGTLAGTVRTGFGAATPFVPELAAFIGATGLAEQVPGLREPLGAAMTPVTSVVEPTSYGGKAAAELGDLVAQALLLKGVHKARATGIRDALVSGTLTRTDRKVLRSNGIDLDNVAASAEKIVESTEDFGRRREPPQMQGPAPGQAGSVPPSHPPSAPEKGAPQIPAPAARTAAPEGGRGAELIPPTEGERKSGEGGQLPANVIELSIGGDTRTLKDAEIQQEIDTLAKEVGAARKQFVGEQGLRKVPEFFPDIERKVVERIGELQKEQDRRAEEATIAETVAGMNIVKKADEQHAAVSKIRSRVRLASDVNYGEHPTLKRGTFATVVKPLDNDMVVIEYKEANGDTRSVSVPGYTLEPAQPSVIIPDFPNTKEVTDAGRVRSDQGGTEKAKPADEQKAAEEARRTNLQQYGGGEGEPGGPVHRQQEQAKLTVVRADDTRTYKEITVEREQHQADAEQRAMELEQQAVTVQRRERKGFQLAAQDARDQAYNAHAEILEREQQHWLDAAKKRGVSFADESDQRGFIEDVYAAFERVPEKPVKDVFDSVVTERGGTARAIASGRQIAEDMLRSVPAKETKPLFDDKGRLVQAIVEQPLAEQPAPVREAIQEKAKDLKAESLGWEVIKVGGVLKHENVGGGYEFTRGIGGMGSSTFPDWFNRLGVSKTKVVEAIDKIIKDKGLDKGKLVEELKAIILKEGTEGADRPQGFIPPDENFAGLIEAHKSGKLDEYLKTTEFPEPGEPVKTIKTEAGEQGVMFDTQAQQPKKAITSSVPLSKQIEGTMFEKLKPEEPGLFGAATSYTDVFAEMKKRLQEKGVGIETKGALRSQLLPSIDPAKVGYILEPLVAKVRADAQRLIEAGKLKAEEAAEWIRNKVRELLDGDETFKAISDEQVKKSVESIEFVEGKNKSVISQQSLVESPTVEGPKWRGTEEMVQHGTPKEQRLAAAAADYLNELEKAGGSMAEVMREGGPEGTLKEALTRYRKAYRDATGKRSPAGVGSTVEARKYVEETASSQQSIVNSQKNQAGDAKKAAEVVNFGKDDPGEFFQYVKSRRTQYGKEAFRLEQHMDRELAKSKARAVQEVAQQFTDRTVRQKLEKILGERGATTLARTLRDLPFSGELFGIRKNRREMISLVLESIKERKPDGSYEFGAMERLSDPDLSRALAESAKKVQYLDYLRNRLESGKETQGGTARHVRGEIGMLEAEIADLNDAIETYRTSTNMVHREVPMATLSPAVQKLVRKGFSDLIRTGDDGTTELLNLTTSGEKLFGELTRPEKKVVDWFTQWSEEMKAQYNVPGRVEGYVRRFMLDPRHPFLPSLVRFRSNKFFNKHVGARFFRTGGAYDYVRDMETVAYRMRSDLEQERIHNTYTPLILQSMLRSVPEGPVGQRITALKMKGATKERIAEEWEKVKSDTELQKAERAWKEGGGGIMPGFVKVDKTLTFGQTVDRFRGQIPASLYDHYLSLVEQPQGNISARAKAIFNLIDAGANYWAGNQLVAMQSVANQAVSDALFTTAKVIHDIPNPRKVLYDLQGLGDALRPSILKALPPEEFGSHATFTSQIPLKDKYHNPLDLLRPAFNAYFKVFGAFDLYAKRAIFMGEARDVMHRKLAELIASGKSREEAKKLLEGFLTDPNLVRRTSEAQGMTLAAKHNNPGLAKDIDEILDQYMPNYGNIPVGNIPITNPFSSRSFKLPSIQTVAESSVGKLTLPFVRYKYEELRMAAGILRRGLEATYKKMPLDQRAGDLLLASSVFGGAFLLAERYKSRLLDEDEDQAKDIAAGRYALSAASFEDETLRQGLNGLGVTLDDGNTLMLRVSKYPFLKWGLLVRSTTDAKKIMQSEFLSEGIALRLLALSSGWTDEFNKYSTFPAATAKELSGFIPFHRVVEDVNRIKDPRILTPKTFMESVRRSLPFVEQTAEQATSKQTGRPLEINRGLTAILAGTGVNIADLPEEDIEIASEQGRVHKAKKEKREDLIRRYSAATNMDDRAAIRREARGAGIENLRQAAREEAAEESVGENAPAVLRELIRAKREKDAVGWDEAQEKARKLRISRLRRKKALEELGLSYGRP